MVTWSTWTARLVSSSSTSRYDNAKRRYQRTASTITSGGKQKPAKADCGIVAGRGRRVLMTPVCLLGLARSRCNSARGGIQQDVGAPRVIPPTQRSAAARVVLPLVAVQPGGPLGRPRPRVRAHTVGHAWSGSGRAPVGCGGGHDRRYGAPHRVRRRLASSGARAAGEHVPISDRRGCAGPSLLRAGGFLHWTGCLDARPAAGAGAAGQGVPGGRVQLPHRVPLAHAVSVRRRRQWSVPHRGTSEGTGRAAASVWVPRCQGLQRRVAEVAPAAPPVRAT